MSHWFRTQFFSARTLARMGAVAFIAWFTVCLMLVAFQRRLVFVGHSQRLNRPLPVQSALLPTTQAFDVTVPVEPGMELSGWACFATSAASLEDGLAGNRPVVLYLGGNAGNRSSRSRAIKSLLAVGADVFIVDYRGYAENPGQPSEEGLAEDARAMWRHLTEDLGVSRDRVVIWGESLGGGVATRLASELCVAGEEPAGLILRATFASLAETASYHYPFVPVRTVLRDRFPSVERIPKVTVPILHFHGTNDRVVPYVHGRELFDAAPAEASNGFAKRFVRLDGVGHNNIMYVVPEIIEAETERYLADIGLLDASLSPTTAGPAEVK